MPRPAAAVLLLLVRIVRWWFGLTYGLGGLWGLTWGFILLFVGNSGEGAFLMFGGCCWSDWVGSSIPGDFNDRRGEGR